LFAAIAAECRECAGSESAVPACEVTTCALHRFRNGPRSRRPATLEQRIDYVTANLAEAEAVLSGDNPPAGARRKAQRLLKYRTRLETLLAAEAAGDIEVAA
jgi:hypothetical protein